MRLYKDDEMGPHSNQNQTSSSFQIAEETGNYFKDVIVRSSYTSHISHTDKCVLLLLCPLRFLDEVQSHSNENKMSVQNLATVFGPNILRPRVEDPVTMMEGR